MLMLTLAVINEQKDVQRKPSNGVLPLGYIRIKPQNA